MSHSIAHEKFCLNINNELQYHTMEEVFGRCQSPPIQFNVPNVTEGQERRPQKNESHPFLSVPSISSDPLRESSDLHDSLTSLEGNSTRFPEKKSETAPVNPLNYTKTIRKSYKKGISRIFGNGSTAPRKPQNTSMPMVSSDESDDDDDREHAGDSDSDESGYIRETESGRVTLESSSLLTAGATLDAGETTLRDDTVLITAVPSRSEDYINRIDHEIDSFSDSDYYFTDLDDSGLDDNSLIDSDYSEVSDHQISFKPPKFGISSAPHTKGRQKKLKLSYSPAGSRRSEPLKKNSSLANIAASTLAHIGESDAPSLEIRKEDILPHVSKSKLTSLLNASVTSEAQPLSKFLATKGISGDKSSVRLNVYVPSSAIPSVPVFGVVVRRESLVFDVLGYILFKYSEKITLTDEDKNPNKWCLRIADDDGEPFDGNFGLLNRVHPISGYSADEVALCQVSDAEYTKNCIETPFSVTTASVTEPNASGHMSSDSTEFKVYLFPYTEYNYTSYFFDALATANELLDMVCKDKNLGLKTHQFRVIPHRTPLTGNEILSEISNTNLELVSLDPTEEFDKLSMGTLNTLPSMMTLRGAMFPSVLPPLGAITGRALGLGAKKPPLKKALSRRRPPSNFYTTPQTPDIPGITGLDFHKWSVLRRQPIAFNNRLEKTLVVDGDYIYLVPNDDKKTWYDPNMGKPVKTSTIHLSRLLGIKKSKKYQAGFKLVVQKSDRVKTYYLEAYDEELCHDIVKKIQSIHKEYRDNKNR
ncbi:hypothetical protein BABINDRAFT_165247 [Babjeviella inositovora NRRL Y-12698]|uniref:Stress-activated map kinase-interacting protein 1 n=1 Tax=Babjeviella inositovora NRRL Y-12698 TaxID=984486 RepID=A0A1E3QVP0_9ASCO|nr:uncharacterized protein BABINDRAFT_165247 [Babjeviella inositovora NRRL Y-12698]ODQ81721.1 hypothetical protein BABINDRAFT_165247 [Babjeviella inositovora NRRL Y-12698]